MSNSPSFKSFNRCSLFDIVTLYSISSYVEEKSFIRLGSKGSAIIEDRYGINFNTKINVVGNLEVIKGMVREGIGNVILPYYAVYKDIKKGDFKVISKIDEVKDGYELIITKDKKDLSQIAKFINIVKSHKIVMESTRH